MLSRHQASGAFCGVLLSSLAALLSGCASSTVAPESVAMPEVYRSVRPDNLPPDYTYQAFSNRVARTPLPPKKTLRTTPEGPVSKEWKVQLTLGQRKALVNGVELWLCEPAVAAKNAMPAKGAKGKGPAIIAGETDRNLTLGPLLHAPTNAYVRTARPPRIMIDPGHGGLDSGATRGKTRESTIALDIARRLSSYLALSGFEVRITRPNDKTAVALEERCLQATSWPADLFVSIHLNSGPAAAAGIETYAIPPAGQLSTENATRGTVTAADREAAKKIEAGNAHDADNIRLAWCIHRRLAAATGRKDRGIRRARFVVLRESTVPAVLVEVGFLSNESDAAFLTTVSGREKAAIGLCRGIMDFCAGHISPEHPALPIGTETKPVVPVGAAKRDARPAPMPPPKPPVAKPEGEPSK